MTMAEGKADMKEPDSDDSEIPQNDVSDTSSSASESESDDSDSEGIVKPVSESTENKSKDFRLSCLHTWSEDTLSSCLKNYLQKLDKEDAKCAKITQKSSPDFTPWWEEFTKLDHHKTVTSESYPHKDKDSYESWFDKDAVGGSSWLCGPGLSSSSLSSSVPSQKSQVEDIQVPSIYDSRPAPKGHRAMKRERRAERQKTLGKQWFGMKAPDVDDKLKMDMELLKMRSVLDPKRFYKHQDRKGLPKYFQMGTVVDEGTDFFSSRLTKKQRKQTLVEELMADANVRQYNKKKYAELQQKMRRKKKFKSRPHKSS